MAMAMSALNVFNFSNDSASRRLARLLLFVHPQAFLFQFMEVFEFPLSFSNNKKFLCVALNCEGVLSVLLKVDVLVLGEAERGQQS